MDRLNQILKQAVAGYAGEALNGYSYVTSTTDDMMFTVVSVGNIHGQHIVDVGLIARILNQKIIIEHDVNDKPLVDALLQAGVPRQQIVLAYAGEPVEEPAV